MQAVLERTEQTFQTDYHVGPYRLLKHLEQGGMASVFLAFHTYTGAYVALKVVDTYIADLQLLYREKEIMQALEHKHIVPCLDAGQDGRYYYMAMPYLRGGTLEDMINEKPLTPEETYFVLEQLTGALTYIHKLGILHRDIKPTNILFDEDYNLYLTDFGIASWLGEKPQRNGRVMGTPHYSAPELFDGYVDERSEVYAVGILLYQVLTGSLPFDDPSDWKICLHHRETRPLAPSFLNPSIPRAIERVILCALEKDPRHRYQSVEALLRAFQNALEGPNFFGYLSTQWQTTCQKLRSRLSPETPPCQPAGELAALDLSSRRVPQR
jgi:eukaryotic-like serine/threonine-protein kinase